MTNNPKVQELSDFLDKLTELAEKLPAPEGTIVAFIAGAPEGFAIRSNGCNGCAEKMIIMIGDHLIDQQEAEEAAAEAVVH